MTRPAQKRARIALDFESREAAILWFHIFGGSAFSFERGDEPALYEADVLDFKPSEGGVGPANTLIVKAAGDARQRVA